MRRNPPNITQLKIYSKLSLAMKEEVTVGFQEMKTSGDKQSLAMREELTVGFQEMRTNRDGRFFAELSLSLLILGFNIVVEKINEWLAAPFPSSNHNTAMKKRQPKTGEWFTKSKEFADWKVGIRSFIWLHGIRE